MLNELKKREKYLESLEKYIKENPHLLPKHGGELIIPRRIADKGDRLTVKLISYGSYNALSPVEPMTADCAPPPDIPKVKMDSASPGTVSSE